MTRGAGLGGEQSFYGLNTEKTEQADSVSGAFSLERALGKWLKIAGVCVTLVQSLAAPAFRSHSETLKNDTFSLFSVLYFSLRKTS